MINNDYEVHALSGIKLEALDGNLALKGTFVELQSHLAFSGVTQAQIQSDLGLEIGVEAQAYAPVLDYLVTTNNSGDMLVNSGSSWVSTNQAGVQSALALVPGTDIQVYSAVLDSVATSAGTSGNFLVANGSGFDSTSAIDARTALQLVIGQDVQSHSPVLDSVAGINLTAGNVVTVDGTGYASVDPATLLSNIGGQPLSSVLTDISTIGEPGVANKMLISDSGTSFQYTDTGTAGLAVLQSANTADAVIAVGLSDGTNDITVNNCKVSQLTIQDQTASVGSYSWFSESLTTTNATSTSLLLSTIPDNSARVYDLTVSGKEISGAAPRIICHHYRFVCSKAVGSNAVVLGSFNNESLADPVPQMPPSSLDITVAVDTTAQAMRCSVIGESGKNWVWHAVMKLVGI